MRVLALDPGPSRTGAALVELPPGASWPRVLRAGHLELDQALAWVAEAVQWQQRVAVEMIVGYAYQASRVAGLVETARVEGRLMEAARGGPHDCLAMPAAEWREQLCGSRTASDDQVRVVVEGTARGIPKLGYRERPHVYDAIGLGIVALWRAHAPLGPHRQVKLPDAVLRALFRVQSDERQARSSKPAKPAAKRAPTRAQSKRRSDAAKAAWRRKS